MDATGWPFADDPLAEHDPSVLVAVVPRLSDWAHITQEHWYHIPLARAPQRIAVDRLAFYHPACFPETAHSVSFYADVQGYELLPREALFPAEPDHPRAHALYYQLRLGPVTALPWPVPAARLRRITFIRTSWQRLLLAQDIVELWPHESLPERLSRELHEAAALYLFPAPA
ncbi:MAG: hypothetical protein ABFD20_03845 [Anaerolineales bacterium]